MGMLKDAARFTAAMKDPRKFAQELGVRLEEDAAAQAPKEQAKAVPSAYANIPEPQQSPDTMAKREADEREVKKKRGGTVLDRNRLGASGVVLGSNKLGAGV